MICGSLTLKGLGRGKSPFRGFCPCFLSKILKTLDFQNLSGESFPRNLSPSLPVLPSIANFRGQKILCKQGWVFLAQKKNLISGFFY